MAADSRLGFVPFELDWSRLQGYLGLFQHDSLLHVSFPNFDHFLLCSQNRWCPLRPALTPGFQTLSTLCWAWCAASVFWCLSSLGSSVSGAGVLTLGWGTPTTTHLLRKHRVDLLINQVVLSFEVHTNHCISDLFSLPGLSLKAVGAIVHFLSVPGGVVLSFFSRSL